MDEPVVRPAAPPVVKWYKAYCGAMVLSSLLGVVFGVLVFTGVLSGDVRPDDAAGPVIYGVFFMLVGVAILAPFLLALLLPPRPWVWVYALLMICLGAVITLLGVFAAIPLLIYWVKPDVKQYFGRAG
jgi:hypothetical protein